MSFRPILAVVLLTLLAACARPAPVPPVAMAPPPVVIDPETACLGELRELRAAYQPIETFGESQDGCGVANPVKVSAGSVPWNRPGVLTCSMARTVVRFEAEVVQPAAMARFGQAVRKIHHAGTYDCRVRRNSTQAAAALGGSKGGRLSEHAKGQAIDIVGFELADGTMVTVKKDWRGAGAKSAFLQEVARASCSAFNVVLTPNHDRLHQDHLHLDIGPHTLCGS